MTPTPPALTDRERLVLRLMGEDKSVKEIARLMGISPNTVHSHVNNLRGKLGVVNSYCIVSKAVSLHMIAIGAKNQ